MPDFVTASGGEWLPSRAGDFVEPERDGAGSLTALRVTAPAVRVPWNDKSRKFFEGTRHCKLISAATMRPAV